MVTRKLALRGLMVAAIFAGTGAAPASASALAALSQAGKDLSLRVADTVVRAAHQPRKKPKLYSYEFQHEKFHDRYPPKKDHNYGKAHDRFHKHHGRRHDGPDFYFGWGSNDFYDPFYYSPYVYDPYYWPYAGVRISCSDARRVLRQHGYRNVKAYDCSGATYGFYATKGKRRYRITVSARDGRITGRKQY